jgi:arylsulfatase A-like enzyme
MHMKRSVACVAAMMLVLVLSGGSVVAERRPGSARPTVATDRPFSPAGEDERPNVLIILIDDMRADELLRMMPRTRTLFKDRGTRFANMFATTPLCCPSRTSILTGEYAHNHHVQDNTNARPFRVRQKYSIEGYLKRGGYKTAILGKILNSWQLARDPSFFHKWSISRGGYSPAKYNINGRLRTIDKYSSTYLADEAVRFMTGFERTDERPWFIEVSTYAAHRPYLPDQRDADADVPRWNPSPAVLETDLTDKPPWMRENTIRMGRAAHVRKEQLRTLVSVDRLVRKLYRTISELDEENTLAFLMADNGFMWGEHGHLFKRTPYDSSVRLPLLMRWPGQVERGAVDERLVANIDIAPTILEAAGIEVKPERPMDGRSLLGTDERERLVLEYWGEGGRNIPTWYSTRTKEFQYTRYENRFGDVLFREYYDLTRDPWQLTNVFRDGDPTNDPLTLPLDSQLDQDRTCLADTCP